MSKPTYEELPTKPHVFAENELNIPQITWHVSQFQYNFDEFMISTIMSSNIVILPVDDDVDGFVCARLFYDLLKIICPDKEVRFFITKNKSHHSEQDLVDHIKEIKNSGKYESIVTIITDSSSQDFEILEEISKLCKLAHIDHHNSTDSGEERLDKICDFHANCMYETNEAFHNLSAGMYVSMLLSQFVVQHTKLNPRVTNDLLSLGVLSLISDCCDTNNLFNKCLLQWFYNSIQVHQIIQAYMGKYSRQDINLLAFTLSPKINMLFRLRMLSEIEQLLTLNGEQLVLLIQNINQQYSNYKKYAKQLLFNVEIIEYPKFAFADMTGLDKYFTIFKGKLSNFTGWLANEISETVSKPCIVTCQQSEDIVKGSIRDANEGDVYSSISKLNYIEYGGHPSAVGFTFHPNYLLNVLYDFNNLYSAHVDKYNNLFRINKLYELQALYRNGTLRDYCTYNQYTLTRQLGIVYKLTSIDVLKSFDKYMLLELGTELAGLKLISFDTTINQSHTIKLVPTFEKDGITLIFSKYEE